MVNTVTGRIHKACSQNGHYNRAVHTETWPKYHTLRSNRKNMEEREDKGRLFQYVPEHC